MYFEHHRWIKKLKGYEIIPDEFSFWGNSWNDLEIPDEPEIVAKGSFMAGQSSRAVRVTYRGNSVIVGQRYEGSSLWVGIAMWNIPENYDWGELLPSSSEVYEFEPKLARFPMRVDGYDLEIGLRKSESNTYGNFESHILRNGERIHFEHNNGIKYTSGPVTYHNSSRGKITTLTMRVVDWDLEKAELPEELFSVSPDKYNRKKKEYHIQPEKEQYREILDYLSSEVQRMIEETVEAIRSGKTLTKNASPALSAMIAQASFRTSLGDFASCYTTSPITILEKWDEAKILEAQKQEEWDQREQSGRRVIALERCWECGSVHIRYEILREGKIQRLSKEDFEEALKWIDRAHKNSMEGVLEETIISSIGFRQDDNGPFEFRILNTDFYDGC